MASLSFFYNFFGGTLWKGRVFRWLNGLRREPVTRTVTSPENARHKAPYRDRRVTQGSRGKP